MIEFNLKENGLEKTSFAPNIQTAVTDLAEAWKGFLLLPDEAKKLLSDNFHNYGYQSNSKEYFDYHSNIAVPGTLSYFKAQESKFNSEIFELLEACKSLQAKSLPMFIDYWRALQGDQHVPDINDNDLAMFSARMATIRCLYYPPGAENGAVLSQPHTDVSGGTVHFF